MIALLVAIQGQEIISMPMLESIAHRESGISPFELHKTYLPLFQEWDFVRISKTKIEETVKSRSRVLERAGKFWQDCNPHNVEKLSIDLFNRTALSPIQGKVVQKTLDNYAKEEEGSALTHLGEAGLVDTLNFDEEKWYYSPEIFGEKYEQVIKYVASRSESERQKINEAIQKVTSDQGIPQSTLNSTVPQALSDQLAGSGLLAGYPIAIGERAEVFYFTPDLRSRFEREGRGDKFELIKTGVAHFQFAHKLADPTTGALKFNPSVLLDKLLDTGETRSATAIGTDYALLVQKGLVRIEPTYGDRYKFCLPNSEDKIQDLRAVRDAFADKPYMPKFDLAAMGIPGQPITSDSLHFRSRKAIKGKILAQSFTKEIFLT